MLIGWAGYGHPGKGTNLASALKVVFWIYVAISYFIGITMYVLIFTGQNIMASNMTPSWMLPIFPVILTGVVAGNISPSLEPQQAFPILVCGLTFQGLGFLVSLLVSAIYLFRLFQAGLPEPNARPGMFLAVGPPSFTGVGLLKMASAIPEDYGYFQSHPRSISIIQTVAVFMGIFLWAYAFWFFTFALISCLTTIKKMAFHLTWYAFGMLIILIYF